MRHEAVRITIPSSKIRKSPCRIIRMATASTISTAMVKFSTKPSTLRVQHIRAALLQHRAFPHHPCICPMAPGSMSSIQSRATECLLFPLSLVRFHTVPTTQRPRRTIALPLIILVLCRLETSVTWMAQNVKTHRMRTQCCLSQ